ncbi:Histidine phosphatase superfamily (branch 1) [Polynucleobacter meluiroseus]|uniref:Histidine phosphatase superfamily (Branch 1) n=1 Tax=Polynucleobacter meluiroseus TaxID=1938814 RepID=A0A240DZK4_9BURK|nr:histidine phosphatase family protein [Polynucleobacter meluiroseus]SNX27691.1 Histidine phosphatase superfamily (branch 1) [Polynucleobacter meluiroseus]
MSQFNRSVLTLIIALCSLLTVSQAEAALVDNLKDGQHVLLMRHADAPGYGDPAGYVISQCATQRNLGDYGKNQAKAIGSWLSKQGIDKAQVFSSPWCRCLDTAQLLNLGFVKTESSLGSFFDDISLEKKQTKELRQLIKSELDRQTKEPIILVTHHVNIQAYTGKVVDAGDMVLVKVNKNGEYLSHVIYPSPKPRGDSKY